MAPIRQKQNKDLPSSKKRGSCIACIQKVSKCQLRDGHDDCEYCLSHGRACSLRPSSRANLVVENNMEPQRDCDLPFESRLQSLHEVKEKENNLRISRGEHGEMQATFVPKSKNRKEEPVRDMGRKKAVTQGRRIASKNVFRKLNGGS